MDTARLVWFSKDDTGDSCSLCGQPIEGPPDRIYEGDDQLRLHPDKCIDEAKARLGL